MSYIELRDAKYYVTPMLTQIVNLIIETSHWPKQWSNSLIKPLYKGDGGDPSEASSYRPVALTNALSRVTEKVLSTQITRYIIENYLIGDEYHGFRPGRGTVSGAVTGWY